MVWILTEYQFVIFSLTGGRKYFLELCFMLSCDLDYPEELCVLYYGGAGIFFFLKYLTHISWVYS